MKEIFDFSEAFEDDGCGDIKFAHTKVIVQDTRTERWYSSVSRQRYRHHQDIDLAALRLTEIPADHIWPKYRPGLTQVAQHVLPRCHVKRPSLVEYGDTSDSAAIAKLFLEEVEICEILRIHPHSNVAQYNGCLVHDGRIKGLCFTQYRNRLSEVVLNLTELQRLECLGQVLAGITHLHKLSLVHNDINPRNIMVDDEGKAVIIDFDSTKHYGEPLGLKGGTLSWIGQDFEFADPTNDHLAFRKLTDWLLLDPG